MHGLQGPLDGKTYAAGIMVGNKEQSDEWIASVVSYIRTNLSNKATMVTAADVAKVRAKTAVREGPYPYDELMKSVPVEIVPSEAWKVTASHSVPTRIGGTAAPSSAFNFEGWSTGEDQKKGMWFQIALPKPISISELHFTSPPKSRGWSPDAPPPLQTYPRAYTLEASDDGKSWTKIAEGKGVKADIAIKFEPTRAKFLRITQREDIENDLDLEIPWAMKEMKLFGVQPDTKL